MFCPLTEIHHPDNDLFVSYPYEGGSRTELKDRGEKSEKETTNAARKRFFTKRPFLVKTFLSGIVVSLME